MGQNSNSTMNRADYGSRLTVREMMQAAADMMTAVAENAVVGDDTVEGWTETAAQIKHVGSRVEEAHEIALAYREKVRERLEHT